MLHKRIVLFVGLLILTVAVDAHAQESADRAAIRNVALDYIEGWYAGDATRMERALHPELAKRMVRTNPSGGESILDQQSAMTLVQGTRTG
jgi:hypothetical protein